MNKTKTILYVLLAFPLVIVFHKILLALLALLVSLIVLIIVHAIIKEYIIKYKLKKFIERNEGHAFIMYSSNIKLKTEIETLLKPLMNFEYTTIYNNRNVIESSLKDYELKHLQNESHGMKQPIIYQVKKSKVYSTSFFEDIRLYQKKTITKSEFETKVNLKLKKYNYE